MSAPTPAELLHALFDAALGAALPTAVVAQHLGDGGTIERAHHELDGLVAHRLGVLHDECVDLAGEIAQLTESTDGHLDGRDEIALLKRLE